MNARSSLALTAIMRLIDAGDAEAAKQLLAKNELEAEGKDAALIYASRKPRADIIQLILDSGADVRAKNKDGMTALMSASANGHIAAIRLLLEKGADINDRDNSGMTALRYAVANENNETETLLKSLGAK